MKGIVLAGGTGTRLYPITKAISKQILPVYDKPMIYYSLSSLLLAGIKDILIISTARDIIDYKNLLKDGSQLGVQFSYKIQEKPRGLADAFIVGKEFIGSDNVALILGDNIFYGQGFSSILRKATTLKEGALIFGYYVNNPTAFGVVEFNEETMDVISIEEKPAFPKSNYAIPGLYFYDNNVIKYAENLKPSPRGELEITDLNIEYLKRGKLKVKLLGRGLAWFDTGTFDGLIEASNFVAAIQKRQGYYIACLEEIAFRLGYIDTDQLKNLAKEHSNSDYGRYLLSLI
ncbi:MAG: glucose-1-phosphate thymidylyltransferase RfbA [Candidatus Heimdallarchaeum aukensis]|uniref:glucose-1-phosphate thymidylyltransferase n=1 Tax=Candidatus Heimdallarchaeum aukensis TaxID=2876573 RepID=A0A9Y1BM41_9ARCH|nr:MAG: glucose-1-phosphate thymidylyltransferase RfbA [Candidatus Heimdallarchaeum aukensis]